MVAFNPDNPLIIAPRGEFSPSALRLKRFKKRVYITMAKATNFSIKLKNKSSMKIAFNALSTQAGGGISAFVNLMPAIATVDNKNQYVIFVSSRQREILEAIPSSFKKVAIDYLPSNPYIRVLWEQVVFPFYLLFYKVNVLYSVGNITTLLAPCKIFLFIENSNPYSTANIKWSWKERLRNGFLKYLGWLSAKRANRVRFASDNSKNILMKQLGLPIKKCVTIYHGLNSEEMVAINNKFKPEYSYILTVSVVAPHKNFEILIKGFDILKKKYKYPGKLLIVGDICYLNYYNFLRNLIGTLNLNDKVIFKGKVAHKDIYGYYLFADAFVFPSLEETFGIPLIEALSLGVPTIASDGEKYKNFFIPFNEIAGNYAIYFDPFSEEDIAEKLNKILSDDNIKKEFKMNAGIIKEKYNIHNISKQLINEFNTIGGK